MQYVLSYITASNTSQLIPGTISPVSTAVHRGLSKYLTAQDTCDTPTITKHNRTLVRLGNLLSLKPRSTIKVNRVFSVPSIE